MVAQWIYMDHSLNSPLCTINATSLGGDRQCDRGLLEATSFAPPPPAVTAEPWTRDNVS